MKALNVSFNLKYQTFQGLKMALNKLLQKKRKKKEKKKNFDFVPNIRWIVIELRYIVHIHGPLVWWWIYESVLFELCQFDEIKVTDIGNVLN